MRETAGFMAKTRLLGVCRYATTRLMWEVVNHTPFKAERGFVRDLNGAEISLVAVRGTFTFGQAGSLQIAEEQSAVCRVPEYMGEPGRSSLRCDHDFVRTKLRTDVLVHGYAYAAPSCPVSHVDVSINVGPVCKRLRIWGDRTWKSSVFGLRPDAPKPFERMPITYERAYGGSAPASDSRDMCQTTHNPIGLGFAPSHGQAVPNVEYPDHPVGSSGWKQRPAGFGPIPPDWSPRRELAGTFNAAWEHSRMPLLPLDFQEAHFQCAPTDQQSPGFLRGGEEVLLVGLTPDGSCGFRLPRVTLGFRTRIDGGTVDHRADLHTVLLEPEARRVTLVWQTALPCHHSLYGLERTTVYEKVHV